MLNNVFRLDFKLFPFVPFDMIRLFLCLISIDIFTTFCILAACFRISFDIIQKFLNLKAPRFIVFTISYSFQKNLVLICSLSSVIGFKYCSHTSSEVTPESISVLYGTSFVYSDFSERMLF